MILNNKNLSKTDQFIVFNIKLSGAAYNEVTLIIVASYPNVTE